MTIRKIKANELNFLADMLYEALFVPEGHAPFPKEIIHDRSLSKYIDNWGKDKYDIAFVVEVDHQLVGAIWGRLLTQENKGYGFVDNNTPELSLAVKSGYRNEGIGTELMRTIASEYKKIGINQLSLSVDMANPASNLYQRLGYKIVEETETSWTMKKEIR